MIEQISIGDIIAAGAVLMALWKTLEFAYDKIVKPRTETSKAIEEIGEDMAAIKKDIAEMKEKLASDYEQLSDHAGRIGKLEQRQDDFRDYLAISLDALRALVEHAIDGNNEEAMQKSLKDIDNYLKRHL